MAENDAAIDEQGGWPGAFKTDGLSSAGRWHQIRQRGSRIHVLLSLEPGILLIGKKRLLRIRNQGMPRPISNTARICR
jgi:hypothetical protein